MRPPKHRTAREWFGDASRFYLEGHQACAWCGGRYRVFKTLRGSRLEYQCNDCNFYVCHDQVDDTYHAELGTEASRSAESCGCEAHLSGRVSFG